ncbi:sporulation membrane protein YtrI [Halalkalibacter krulwichiae]|uniref:Sporulation membrane protein YtrI n=1 Tax=Halalkalibacter krulwichiae TaxID=199441 RepID=A0A1X9ME41_9BACI|nr:sporulation membrane protein YtrI [Halalkalibacter krulwichiae]ARK31708.1 Sporulation membrane protein YtrI [Halalkalibacter krulwichiae]
MRIPPLYERRTVQRFFAGIILGILIGWFFFIYQYGQVYEGLIFRLSEQEAVIDQLEKDIEQLLSEQRKLNEENQKKLTIQEIEIQYSNDRKLRLNQLTLLDLKQQALQELQYVKRKDIETVSNMKDLMISSLENKVFSVGERRYQLKVEEVYLYTTLTIHVKIVPSG